MKSKLRYWVSLLVASSGVTPADCAVHASTSIYNSYYQRRNLRGLDQLLTGYARISFNYLVAGYGCRNGCRTDCRLRYGEAEILARRQVHLRFGLQVICFPGVDQEHAGSRFTSRKHKYGMTVLRPLAEQSERWQGPTTLGFFLTKPAA